jgi:DNA-binding XRE family transcriptional regulator
MDKDLWINGKKIKMQLTKEYLNMSQDEVAEALNINRKAVLDAERSGIEKIRKALEQRGIDIKMLLGD